MNIKNTKSGFSKLFIMAVLVVVLSILFLFACSGSDETDKVVQKKNVSIEMKDIKDTSMEFKGSIAQTTCLNCHPALKDGGFNIDFTKVKEAGMIIDKGQDVIKEDKKESEK